MAVINVLYLPRDDRLRAIVRTALDFVEEVYRDEILSDLKFISLDPDDDFDADHARYVAEREGLLPEIEALISFYVLFYWPHYVHKTKHAWVPVSKESSTSDLLENVAHEVTHHVFHKLPAEDKMALATALRSDLGVEVDEMIRKRKSSRTLVENVASIINETATIYIVYNYFLSLEREPKTPTPQSNIRDFISERHRDLVANPPRPKHKAEVLGRIYRKMAYDDLPNYRKAIHETFMKLVKKLPVDVLKSNRAKYEILYRQEPIA